MKIYKLTKEGRRVVKVPSPDREVILDHLYEFKTATRDELLAIDGGASTKLSTFTRKGYVEELNGF